LAQQLDSVEQSPAPPAVALRASPHSSQAKKRLREDSENAQPSGAAPRAIVMPPSRVKAALPSPTKKSALAAMSEKKPRPLGQVKRPLAPKAPLGETTQNTATKGADQLMASLHALRQPRAA
jgi:hypothetical protein